MMWLFIGVSLKIIQLRSSPVVPLYLKQGLFFTVILFLFCIGFQIGATGVHDLTDWANHKQ